MEIDLVKTQTKVLAQCDQITLTRNIGCPPEYNIVKIRNYYQLASEVKIMNFGDNNIWIWVAIIVFVLFFLNPDKKDSCKLR